ncbi:DnaJ domain containing protein [Tritrichomonas foetus]|uniref:DnaJ domain containing protein n=1 Tax=Tritrichomonas foetus TaxID=1144522 RepID=A0A1J4JNU9_9EUKA|nr:DnaJ domain containing protein [Tritrichomonas foetus]|eukprot:OHT00080.1 DnaJ domain containing protein [Tritrichomonas foetus]
MIFLISLLNFVQKFNTSELTNVNFYQLTGLQKTDNDRAVVRSFKRFLSQKKKHPGPTERTLKLWKQTQLAYDILGNPDSRALYDAFGMDFVNVTGFQVMGYQSDATLEALKQMFGGQVPPEMQNYGGMIFYPVQFDILEYLTGSEKTVKVFRQTRCVCPKGRRKCAECRRNPWKEEVVEHKIQLPQGATEYHRIIAKGFGDPEKGRGATDVIFICYCKPDELFKRDGADILTNVTINLATAIRGGEIEIENFDGQKIEVDIQGGVQHGETRRIPDHGLPYFLDPTKRGDLVVTFAIEFPETLTEEQKKIIQEELPDDPSLYE